MKSVVVFCFLAVLALASARPDSEAYYTDRFDNVNVQEILNNRRLLSAYISCILEKGKCTNEGRELKIHIREAIENKCEKCTEVQRKGTRTVISHLINHEPAFWDELVAKYDPERKYVLIYEEELKAIKA